MMLPPITDRLENAMAEEFENYEARLAEAHRAVERWETEGGSRATEHPVEQAPGAIPDPERTHPAGELGAVKRDRRQCDRGAGHE